MSAKIKFAMLANKAAQHLHSIYLQYLMNIAVCFGSRKGKDAQTKKNLSSLKPLHDYSIKHMPCWSDC